MKCAIVNCIFLQLYIDFTIKKLGVAGVFCSKILYIINY